MMYLDTEEIHMRSPSSPEDLAPCASDKFKQRLGWRRVRKILEYINTFGPRGVCGAECCMPARGRVQKTNSVGSPHGNNGTCGTGCQIPMSNWLRTKSHTILRFGSRFFAFAPRPGTLLNKNGFRYGLALAEIKEKYFSVISGRTPTWCWRYPMTQRGCRQVHGRWRSMKLANATAENERTR